VIAIENKIRSGESQGQLERYHQVVRTEFGDLPSMYVFLTIEGDESSEEEWVPYSYGDLHRVLLRVRKANKTSIGGEVLTFLNHYLRLIRGRLMDDNKIVELCQRIYKNHRQALQLIYEHAGSPASGLLGEIERVIAEHPGQWHIVNKTSTQVQFVPRQWLDLFPPIGSRATFDRRCWVIMRFEIRNTRGFSGAYVWPTSNPELRMKIIRRLTSDPAEFGFRLLLRETSNRFSALGRKSIGSWTEEDGPDAEVVLAAVKKRLDELVSQLAGVPEAIRPIFESSPA